MEIEIGTPLVMSQHGLFEVTDLTTIEENAMAVLTSPRGSVLTVPVADLPAACRQPVDPVVAADSLEKLRQPEADDCGDSLQECFEQYGEVLAGHDFDEQVRVLRALYAIDRKANRAALTLGFYFEQSLLSEIAYLLNGDMEALRATMPSVKMP